MIEIVVGGAGHLSQEPFVIHSHVQIYGGVVADCDVIVFGHVKGRLTCRRAEVHSDATITGDIVAQEADVAGTVEGNVFAHLLFLRSSCRVFGDIYHSELQLDAGCFFEGKSRHTVHPGALAD